MNTKIKAYTLFEIIISMVIMSVISLIVFVLFSSFLRQINLYNETNTELSNYTFLKNNLKREFFQAEEINANSNSIYIKMNDSTNISYAFYNTHIVKKLKSTTDTLFVKLSNFNIQTNHYDNVNALTLDCTIFNEPISCTFYKKYRNSINIKSLLNEN